MSYMQLHEEHERGSPSPKVLLSVRIDPNLLEWLKGDAEANCRSVAGSLHYHLWRSKEQAA